MDAFTEMLQAESTSMCYPSFFIYLSSQPEKLVSLDWCNDLKPGEHDFYHEGAKYFAEGEGLLTMQVSTLALVFN